MGDKRKTRDQLRDELAQARQKISALETLVSESKQTESAQTEQLVIEQKQRHLVEMLYQMGTELSSTLNVETVLDCIMGQVGQIVPHDAACLMLIENGIARVFRWQGYGPFGAAASFASLALEVEQNTPLQTVLTTGRPLVIPTVKDGDPQIYGFSTPGIKSHLAAPLRSRGQTMGVINLDSATSGFFHQTDANRLQAFAGLAAAALRNSKLYDHARQEIAQRVKALKKERNFVSAVLDTAGALVMVLNPEGQILRFNRACEQISGYTLNEVKGRCFWELFAAPKDREVIQSIFRALLAGQQANEYESYLPARDGKQHLVVWSNTVLLNHKGAVEYIVSSGIDITERRQLEERLLAIHRLGRELNLLRNETDILEIALETAAASLQFDSAGYGLLDESTGELVYGYRPASHALATLNLRLPLDDSSRIARLLGYRDRPAPAGDNPAWLTAPIKIGGHIIGVFDVEKQPPNHFAPTDRQLLQTLADQTAVAIENARLHEEARQRVAELATMNVIGQAITSTLNLEKTLTIVTNHAIRLLEAGAASVVLHDEERDDLWFNTASGGEPDFIRGQRLGIGQGIVGWVIRHGEPALVPDVTKDRRFFPRFDRQSGFKTRSVLCVPLQTRRRTIGAIEVINKQTGAFGQEDLRLLSWLAAPATIAIENARLFEGERAARQQAEILREATATLTAILNPDQVLNSILVHLERVVPYDRAYVFLQNEDSLQAVAERGPLPELEHTAGRQYPANNPAYRAIQTGRAPVILADAQTAGSFKIWEETGDVRGWMGVPLIVQNEVIGCLTLDSRQPAAYGQAEADLAQAFAHQAAIAIQNARLFEQVQFGRQQQQSLSRRLVEIQEAERRQIARELHDEAGQSLTSLMFGLRLLEREAGNPKAIAGRVVELKEMVNDISKNLHRLAIDLRPASLDHSGLVAALRQYVEKFGRQHNINIQFETVGLDQNRLPLAVETNLYRIVQEALTNIARHARAGRVDILLERRGNRILAIIEDNGVGFDPQTAAQTGRLGLLGMRERTEMMGGHLTVESIINTGTTIYVEVPYGDTDFNR